MIELAFWLLAITCLALTIIGSIYYIQSNNERRTWADRYYITMKYAIKHLTAEELKELEEQLKEVR